MSLVRVFATAACAAMTTAAASTWAASESRPLFNGKDLQGWVAEGQAEVKDANGTRPVWTARDGKIVCEGKGFGFLRYDREQFADFDLHVEFRMAPRCNSGVGVRTTVFDPTKSRATRPSFYSYEIQLTDDTGKPPSKLSTASLYRYVAPSENAIKPAGEWNSLVVSCDGPKVKVTLNGKTVIDVDQSTIEALKNKPLKGFICLQNHGGNIEFREVRVREHRAPAAR
jgi:hypothetical protein